jgi:hypothetical protein
MNGRIAHLHNRYRPLVNHGDEGFVASRLDRIAAEMLPEALASRLAQALDDVEPVYILRQVKTRPLLQVSHEVPDSSLARRWAGYLTASIVRLVHQSGQEGADWVRFDSQAEYIARFISDLLAERDGRFWFYFPLAPYRTADMGATIRRLLLDNTALLPQILTCLHRQKTLDTVLARLDHDTLLSLWSADLAETTASLRPLFVQALQLVDILNLWQTAQPATIETLFNQYLATSPTPADWQDRRSLARAVLAILRYLANFGYLDLTRLAEFGETTALKEDIHLIEASEDIDLAEASSVQPLSMQLREWDWLDVDWLIQAMPEYLHQPAVKQPAAKQPEGELPVRPSGFGPTPRQKTLLDDLLAAVSREPLSLDRHQPDSAANALRLYGLLVEYAPQWAEVSVAKDTIRRLLHAWRWLLQNDRPLPAWTALHKGDVPGAIRTLPPGDRPAAALAFRRVLDLGETAVTILEQFGITTAQPGQRNPAAKQAVTAVDTTAAGLFLLLRPVLDVRLDGLAARISYPPAGGLAPHAALLLALALRWAGADGRQEGQIDPGLGLLAGQEQPPAGDTLLTQWATLTQPDHARFQAALLPLLAGQRLFNGDTLFLYQTELAGIGPALVAGAGSDRLWLLAQAQPGTDIAPTVDAWVEAWQAATGVAPSIVTTEPLLAALAERADVQPAAGDAYQRGEAALVADFAALAPGCLGMPDADLTVGLTAVALMRLWARWLRQFAASSTPYLLSNLIHRPGTLLISRDEIVVEMETRPLDMVLHMAGYLDPIEGVPWLEPQRVRFTRRGLP